MPTRMPFGKYRGRDLEDVDTSYLLWLLENVDLAAHLLLAVRRELHARDADEPRGYRHEQTRRPEPPPRLPDFRAVVSRWHRQMSRQFHPDSGGNERAMMAVNAGRDAMLELLRDEGLLN